MTTDLSGTKRKAEFELVKEEKEERCEKEEKYEMLKSPMWGEDSFDGMEYYESEDEKAVSDDDEEFISNLEQLNEEYRRNKRQVIESKRFLTDPDVKPSTNYFRHICPAPLHAFIARDHKTTYGQYFERMVHVCLKKLNDDNSKNSNKEGSGSKVEFVDIVRANYRGGPRSKSYITFRAKEKSDGPVVEYQAKCMHTMDNKLHPMLCRRAPNI